MNIRKGLALIMANAKYSPYLGSCEKDGIDMSKMFSSLEFDVMEAFDTSRIDSYVKISDFLNVADSYSTVIFYYSGHGVQIDGKNYLVPIDYVLNHNKDVFINTSLVDLDIITNYMERNPHKTNIIILDACRDTPVFTKGLSGHGLAKIMAGSGTYIAYATSPDSTAEGNSLNTENSTFTKHLLNHINKPNAKIEDIFKWTRVDVEKETDRNQIPWESTSLKSDFYFNTMSEATINENIYQSIRNNYCAATLILLSKYYQKSISELMRIYEFQKSEKPGGISISSIESIETLILKYVLDLGFYFKNYRWHYNDIVVQMGEFLHDPQNMIS